MPIKIEMDNDDCNINGNVDSETKSGEMTKKHFTKQTPRLGAPQQTMTQNWKTEGVNNENLEKVSLN